MNEIAYPFADILVLVVVVVGPAQGYSQQLNLARGHFAGLRFIHTAQSEPINKCRVFKT